MKHINSTEVLLYNIYNIVDILLKVCYASINKE